MEAIQPAASGFRRYNDHGTDPAAEDPPVTRDNTSSVADVHHSEISSMVADVHQSRGINRREADVLPLTVNPPATNGVEESGKYCAYVTSYWTVRSHFYPAAVAPSN